MAKFNYDKSVAELEKILTDIQSPDASIEDLSVKLKRAKELLKACKTKLREVESDIESALSEDDEAK